MAKAVGLTRCNVTTRLRASRGPTARVETDETGEGVDIE